MLSRKVVAVMGLLAALGLCAWYFSSSNTRLSNAPVVAPIAREIQAASGLPRPDHVIVVIEENKSFGQIVGNTKHAPYLNSLLPRAAVLTNSHGVAHPSQPNYFALFSGVPNTDGDSCDVDGVGRNIPNLGGELLNAHDTFVGYAEDLPSVGFTGCYAGQYARKHVPWTHFEDIPPKDSRPYSDFPAFEKLPTVAFVVPNLLDDMHSASIDRGDAWLRAHLAPLIDWSLKHRSLVVITWDEDNGTAANHIPTLFLGQMVKPGSYDVPVTHYDVLRTIEDFYGLPHAGGSASASPIAAIWSGKKL